jgi:hypothetical protein
MYVARTVVSPYLMGAPRDYLLPYTELTKDYVQDVFDVHQTRDLAYRLSSIA